MSYIHLLPNNDYYSRFLSEGDISYIRKSVKQYCIQLGFHGDDLDKIHLILTEALTNIIKYANSYGLVHVKPWVDDNNYLGLDLRVSDNGPGIEDIEEAMSDGFSTSNSLGLGLGAIRRLCDDFKIETKLRSENPGQSGTKLYIKKYARSKLPEINSASFQTKSNSYRSFTAKPSKFEIIKEIRAKNANFYNGDAINYIENEKEISLIIVDGLGHGIYASQAASLAISVHSENYENSLIDIVKKIHEKLNGSVGCQMMVMRIDKENKIAYYVGVGNIRGFVIKRQNFSSLLTKDGTIGRKLPTLKEETIDLLYPTIIILHSDGISRSWSWDAKKINIMHYGLNNIISDIVGSYRKENDDASVVGVKNY